MGGRLGVLGLPSLRPVRLETHVKRLTPADVRMLRQISTSRPNVIHWGTRVLRESPLETTVCWYDYHKLVTPRLVRLVDAGLVSKPSPRFRHDSGIAAITAEGVGLVDRIDEAVADGAEFHDAARAVWPPPCPTCWGSHGCDLRTGHDGDHACLPDGIDGRAGYVPGDWSTACLIWPQDDPGSFPCGKS